ncbi:hypothetical protein C2G38_2291202 [Gigaspora rosea]|uniref:Uncharacterized protein n=1 Tax=Gigaspora rosea TaxID=44941 RepID=A0A397U121_9GLOM|nr:hypothetical protein C2G38_2291202 [Gigaspora rosea]
MGNAIRINNLGCCNQDIIGVEMGEHKAFDYHQKSAINVQNPEGSLFRQYSPGTNYHNEIDSAKNEEKASKWSPKSTENKKLSRCYESLEAACVAWKKKVRLFKTQINETECENQKVKMSSCSALNNNAEINKECSLSNNDLQKMCNIWVNKVACIRGSQSLKKHSSKVDDIKLENCKDISNSPPFSNENAVKVNGMLMDKRNVKVEPWIPITIIKIYVTNYLVINVQSTDKDETDYLVKLLFKKDNFGDRGKKKKKKKINK